MEREAYHQSHRRWGRHTKWRVRPTSFRCNHSQLGRWWLPEILAPAAEDPRVRASRVPFLMVRLITQLQR
jgi:hypothetical protein